jgi:hypothetical protein
VTSLAAAMIPSSGAVSASCVSLHQGSCFLLCICRLASLKGVLGRLRGTACWSLRQHTLGSHISLHWDRPCRTALALAPTPVRAFRTPRLLRDVL